MALPASAAPPSPPARLRLPGYGAGLILALALGTLYRDALRTGFLNDDFLFLEQARAHPWGGSLLGPGAIGNYFRPLARQVYFGLLAPLAGGHPALFHLAGFAIFLAALALLFDLLRALVPVSGALAGTLYFALLPFQRVNLTWISCSQDLLALTLVLASLALERRGRRALALLAALGAFASKEIALGLPVAVFAWSAWIERRAPHPDPPSVGAPGTRALRRAAPFALLALGWAAIALGVALRSPGNPGLHFDPSHFAAGLVHAAQSLLGLEHPAGFARALLARGPDPLALVLIAALAAWLPGHTVAGAAADAVGAPEPRGAAPAPISSSAPDPAGAPAPRGAARFALAWLLGFGLLTGPVSGNWSGYYYTVPAVGGALLVALALPRLSRAAFLVLAAALLWWHAGGTGTRAFAVREDPWGWTSHFPSAYFERAARLTARLSDQLRTLEPAPVHGERLFFATLPPFAGFQMGNGALVRALYRDPSLASYFFSQFSESTAALAPNRFYYWDGAELRPLYRASPDPFFQVGTDLLLLDRPAGAAHAFRRALESGGIHADNLYWLGWAKLWSGDRPAAEAAWKQLGAVDDTARWSANMGAARIALVSLRDTLEGRRTLVEAVRYGMGRPEPHGALGGLLLARQPKYAMLELKVATYLNPDDWMSRRALLGALLDARLEDAARRELGLLLRGHPELTSDPVVVRARRVLEVPPAPEVIEL